MGDINGDALRGLSDVIKGIKDGGDKLTLTTGTVVSSTASETWVQVESGQRFPVGSSTVDAAQGDTVNVTIQKGTATITGNSSQKATNANYVDSTVEPVREAAEQAAKAASEATVSAGQAKEQAAAATEAATEAKEKSQAASDAATAAATSASEAATSAKNSAASASTAATNATNAATSAKTAESKATAAATSASNAESSASAAKTSASNAAADASTAKTQATNAATSASNAESSASAAQTSAKTAAADAATAKTQATNAASSASAAQTSAKTAESKATAAATSASNAESSAASAKTSASNAATDAATAKTQATNAATSASKAETSASAAQTSAKNAESSASAAQTSAKNAETSASAAQTQATNAATSASAAQSSAAAAQASAKNAESSASAAATSASNAESSASAAATSASAAASDAATAKSQASAATTAANEAKTQAASAVTSATEAKTQAAAAKTAADQATTDAATAGIAASRAQTAAQAAEKAIGIEPDDTKTEDELASQAWFWTDGGGAHIVAGRKDGTPTSTTQTDINDKGLSVVSLEDYSTLASFGVDSDGKAVSRLGETTGSYTEVTESGLDTYLMSGEITEITVSEAESLSSDKILTFGANLVSGSAAYKVSYETHQFVFKVDGLADENNQKPAIAVKVSDYLPTVAMDGFAYLTGYRISEGFGSGSSAAPMVVHTAIVSEIPSDGMLFDADGHLRNVIDENKWIYKDTWNTITPKDSYFVTYYDSWNSTSEPEYPLGVEFLLVSKHGYVSAQTKHHITSIGADGNGLIRAKIGDEGFVQVSDMDLDIYRAEADISTKSVWFKLNSGSQATAEAGWTSAIAPSTSTKDIVFTIPSGFSDTAYSVFKLTDVWDIIDTSTRKLDISLTATSWASDSSISYIEFYIIDKPYLYDDSGEMVDYLYYSGQELPLSVTTDEMQWAKIQNLYIAFNLGTVPDSLPADVSVGTKAVTAYLYTPTGEATLQSHFGRKTELAYREAAGKEPMFSLDPDAGFMLQAPASTGASITGDNDSLYLGASTKGSIDAYAGSINIMTDNAGERHLFQNKEASIIYENSAGSKVFSLGYGMDSLELWNIQPRWKIYPGAYMTAGQTATFEDVSFCSRGIVLVWSLYENGAVKDNACSFFFIPKQWIIEKPGIGTPFFLPKWGLTGNHGYKYVYINRTSIAGNANNSATGTWGGIVVNNWNFVLHYVYGI